jgi:hypothetical protein
MDACRPRHRAGRDDRVRPTPAVRVRVRASLRPFARARRICECNHRGLGNQLIQPQPRCLWQVRVSVVVSDSVES